MVLKTPTLSSEYTMYTDTKDGKEVLVWTVGKTVLLYDYRCLTGFVCNEASALRFDEDCGHLI